MNNLFPYLNSYLQNPKMGHIFLSLNLSLLAYIPSPIFIIFAIMNKLDM